MHTWQMQHAKARLTELVNIAQLQGPQIINIRGKAAAAVISMEDFINISGREPNIVQFLRNSPLKDVGIELKRNKSRSRKIEL